MSSILGLSLYAVAFWASVNALSRLLSSNKTTRSRDSVRTVVSVSTVTIRCTTVRWNDRFGMRSIPARIAQVFYSVGLLAALLLAGTTGFNMGSSIVRSAGTDTAGRHHHYYDFETDVEAWRTMHTFSFASHRYDDHTMAILIPGVNVPLSDSVPYMLGLAVSVIVHELGHALAAGSERVKIQSIGAFVYGVVPGAFVNICSADIDRASVLSRLRIYTAGVWHNLLLSYVAFLCLSSHALWRWGYSVRARPDLGLMVVDVHPQSDLVAVLRPYDSVILRVNGESIAEPYHFYLALNRAHKTGAMRSCFPNSNFVRMPASATSEAPRWTTGKPSCCRLSSEQPISDEGHLCFSNELSVDLLADADKPKASYACVNYPDLLYLQSQYPNVYTPCTSDNDCQRLLESTSPTDEHVGSDSFSKHTVRQASAYASRCLQMQLAHPDMTVLQLEIAQLGDLEPLFHARVDRQLPTSSDLAGNVTSASVLWLGVPKQMARDGALSDNARTHNAANQAAHLVAIGNVFPRYRTLPVRLPYLLDSICWYTMQISLAMGAINALPLPNLDGQYVIRSLPLSKTVDSSDPPIALHLAVTILDGKNLAGGSLFSSPDCYARISIRGQQFSSTHPAFATVDPVWGCAYEFDGVIEGDPLLVTVWSKGGNADEQLGRATFTVTSTTGEEVTLILPLITEAETTQGSVTAKYTTTTSTAKRTSWMVTEVGPVRYARHISPGSGWLAGVQNSEEQYQFATYQIQLHGVEQAFNYEEQHHSLTYPVIQRIFGTGVDSQALRAGIHAEHAILYRHSAATSKYGVLRSAQDLLRLLENGQRQGKQVLYSYAITSGGWYFSETGSAKIKDFISKHTIHANARKQVYYAGEFHLRPARAENDGYVLVVDNNSGTYAPSAGSLPLLRRLMERNFAGLQIEARTMDDPVVVEARERIAKLWDYIRFTPLSGALNENPLCYLLELDDAKILLDCGWNERFDIDLLQPLRKHAKTIDYVLLSHGDVAHVGALAYAVAKMGLNCPIYATLPVQTLGRESMYDAVLSQRDHRQFDLFSRADVTAAFTRITQLKFMQPYKLAGKISGTTIIAYGAGHTAGGTIWKISKDTDNIVYAVNVNHKKERHLSAGMVLVNSQIYEPLSRPSLLISDCYNATNVHAAKKNRDQALTSTHATPVQDAHALLTSAPLASVMNVLESGGNVLLPSDTASRVLELSYILEQYWSERRISFPIALLSHTSNRVIYHAKSMLEWFGENLTKAFSNAREYPFDFKHIKIITKESELDKLPSPKVVIASMTSLEFGFARGLFLDWCTSPKNAIILTQRGENSTTGTSLARTLVDAFAAATTTTQREDASTTSAQKPEMPSQAVIVPDLSVTLTIEKRVPLEGAELQAHLEQTRLQAAADAHQAAVVAKNKNILERDLHEDEEDEDDSDNDSDAGMLQDGSNGLAVAPGDVERVLTVSHDVYVRGNSIVGGAFRNGQRVCMFPYNETRRRFDEYGEAVKADMFMTEADKREAERERDMKLRLEKQREEDDADAREAEEDTTPSRYLAVETKLTVKCLLQYVDFEGLSDGRSLCNILPQIQPRQMILVHGSQRATEFMKSSLQAEMAAEIMAPAVGESLNVSAATNIFQVKLTDTLFSALPMRKYSDYDISLIMARVTLAEDGNTPVLDVVPAAEMQRPPSYVVGSVRLSEFKRVLDRTAGLRTEFVQGLLVVNGKVGVRKLDNGQLMLEGGVCREYYLVRDLLYKQHAVLS
ncbi:hypothetical protein RI367_001050 [Sorochytrium milnesiophthora]